MSVASRVVFAGFEWADAVYGRGSAADSGERFWLGVVILFGLTAAVISALVLRAILPRMTGLAIAFEGAMAAMVAGSIVAAGFSSFLLVTIGRADSAVFSPWQGFGVLAISFSLLALAVEYAVVRMVARPIGTQAEGSGRGSAVSVAILASGVILVAAVVIASGRDTVDRHETPRPVQAAYFTEVRETEQVLIRHYAGLWTSIGDAGSIEFREQVLDAERVLRSRIERLERIGSPEVALDLTHTAFVEALGTFSDALFLVRDPELNEGDPAAKLTQAALVSELGAAFERLATAGFEVDDRTWVVVRGEPLASSTRQEQQPRVGVEPPARIAAP